MGFIYCLVCLKTNKKYIGSSKTNLTRRINQHFYHKKLTNELYVDIQQYGREGFLYGIIEEDIPLDKLYQEETNWIQKYPSDSLYNQRRVSTPSGTRYERGYKTYYYKNREEINRKRREKYRETHPD